MNAAIRAAGVLLVALGAFATPATAHVEPYGGSKIVTVGPYVVFLTPDPADLYANRTFNLRALVSETQNGTAAEHVDVTVEMRGPQGQDLTLRLPQPSDPYQYRTAKATLEARGNTTLHITANDSRRGYEADSFFLVFADLPFHILPVGPQIDPEVATEFELTVHLIDATNGRLYDGLQDLNMTIEHWTDDHLHLLGVEDLTLRQPAPGIWSVPHSEPVAGMYHLRFASKSGAFGPDDVPTYHLYVVPPFGTPSRSSTPAPATPILALGLLSAAWVRRSARHGPRRPNL